MASSRDIAGYTNPITRVAVKANNQRSLAARTNRLARQVRTAHANSAHLSEHALDTEKALYCAVKDAIRLFNSLGSSESAIQEACLNYLREFTDKDINRL